jgi:hypothetical protein
MFRYYHYIQAWVLVIILYIFHTNNILNKQSISSASVRWQTDLAIGPGSRSVGMNRKTVVKPFILLTTQNPVFACHLSDYRGVS